MVELGQLLCTRIAQGVDRALAAHAAARRSIEVSFETFEVNVDVIVEIDADRI
jgi:hypothetical protein